jgi:hypothetical protein
MKKNLAVVGLLFLSVSTIILIYGEPYFEGRHRARTFSGKVETTNSVSYHAEGQISLSVK